MARGFESKSVEQQQEEAKREFTPQSSLTASEVEGRRKRDGLLLSRKNIVSRLATATNSAHREMLEKALADLDNRIAGLEP